MALVSEIQRTQNGATFVAARFVLLEGGPVVAVEVAPRGLALVREAVEHGLPKPTGHGGNVTLAAGRAFLDALPETYRRAMLRATPPFELDDRVALSGLDVDAPAPVVRLVETDPRARPLQTLAPPFTIGDGPDDDACLTPIRGCTGTFTRFVWRAGWLWAEAGASPDAGRLSGAPLRPDAPAAPVDPGADLIYGNRSFRIDYSPNPSATPRAPR